MEATGPTPEPSERSLFLSTQGDQEAEPEAEGAEAPAEEGPRGTGLNPLLRPALTGDVEGLQEFFKDPEHPQYRQAMQLLLAEDVVGRNLLYAACMAGQSDVIRALAKQGVDLNVETTRGYTLLHCAAAWGRLETLKVLVELDADIEARNYWEESARDVAARYSQAECVEFLERAGNARIGQAGSGAELPGRCGGGVSSCRGRPCRPDCSRACLAGTGGSGAAEAEPSDARLTLKRYIAKAFAGVTDTEKGQLKLLKEDKNTILNACRTKTEWLEAHPQATVREMCEQRQQLEDVVTPIYAKVTQTRQVRSAKAVV